MKIVKEEITKIKLRFAMSKNCKTCGNKLCLFNVFCKESIETEMWTDTEKVILLQTFPNSYVNCVLQKRLYQEFALWNGTMTKPPTKHPNCVKGGCKPSVCLNIIWGSRGVAINPIHPQLTLKAKKCRV